MDLGAGIAAHAKWSEPQFTDSLVESLYAIRASNGDSSYDDCVDECVKISCFAVAYLNVGGPTYRCRLASEPFTYAKDPDNSDTITGTFSFIKYLNDVCADVGPPPTNAEFVAEDDLSTIEQGFDDVLKCKDRCFTLSCTDYTFLPQQNACKFWLGDDDSTVRASSSQTCVLKPLDDMRAFASFSTYYKADERADLIRSNILSINENVDNCWDQCARDPFCRAVAITEEYCYLLDSDQIDHVDDGMEFMMIGLKQFEADSHCDMGEIQDHLIPFRDDPSKCQSFGMCHRNLGTSETPNLACFLAKGPNPLVLTFEDGAKASFVASWVSNIYTETTLESNFPIEKPTKFREQCLMECINLSCLVIAQDGAGTVIDSCRLATTESLTYDLESTSENRLTRVLYFAKHGSLIDELCPVEEPLPPNWQFHFATYTSYDLVEDSTLNGCIGGCNGRGECIAIFRSETSSCLLFESKDIFDSESVFPSTDSGLKRECVVEPVNGGIFRPKILFDVYDGEGFKSAEPREVMEVPFDQERNRCWEYCSQMPWCKAVHYTSGTSCLLFDREENTLRPAAPGELQFGMYIAIGKQYADEDFCDRGGAIDKTFFATAVNRKDRCEFYHGCHRDSKAGENMQSICYLGREIQPEPIRISPVCEAQPFFTSNPGSSKYCTAFEDDYTTQPEGSASYDACALICITDENCYGFVYFPTTQECKTMANDASFFGSRKRDAIQARNDDDDDADDDLECQIALEVPFCEPCYQKVQMEQQITYKEELQCTHTMQESCSDVYKTIFKTQEVEECKESFVKNCHIEYEMVPTSEKVEICHSPLTRDCNEEGPEICSTEYETVCATTYHENEVTDDVVNCNTVKEEVCDSDNETCRMVPRQVCEVEQVTGKKLTPETDCHQESREVCGPEVCPIVPGERICADEIKTFVREVPQEKCEISPKTVCNMIHKIVPKLEMNQECIEVPQENCQRVQVEAKKEWIPVMKHFCASVGSDSSEESTETDDNSSTPDPTPSLKSATEGLTPHLAHLNSSLFDHFPFSSRGSRRNSKSGR